MLNYHEQFITLTRKGGFLENPNIKTVNSENEPIETISSKNSDDTNTHSDIDQSEQNEKEKNDEISENTETLSDNDNKTLETQKENESENLDNPQHQPPEFQKTGSLDPDTGKSSNKEPENAVSENKNTHSDNSKAKAYDEHPNIEKPQQTKNQYIDSEINGNTVKNGSSLSSKVVGGNETTVGGNQMTFENQINYYLDTTKDKKAEDLSEQSINNYDIEFTCEYSIRLQYNNISISADDINEYYNKLLCRRIIGISCLDKDVALTAADTLMTRLSDNLKITQKRMIEVTNSLGEGESSKEHIYQGLNIFDQISSCSDQTKKSAILIEAYRSSDLSFIENVLYSAVNTGRFEKRFADLNEYIIFIVKQDLFKKILKKNAPEFPELVIWDLDFLMPLLVSVSSQKHSSKELYASIINQVKGGYWGNKDTDFYNIVKQAFIDHTLADRIIDLQKMMDEDPEKFNSILQERVKNAQDLFDNKGELEKIVLFVAAYFPGISFEEFEGLVLYLVNDSTQTVTQDIVITDNDGKNNIIKKESSILLSDEWIAKADIIRDLLQLTIKPREDKSESIDFKNPYIRNYLKQFINKKYPSFLRKQALMIRFSPILFEANVKVLDNAILLMVEMANKNTKEYGQRWLSKLIIGVSGLKRSISENDSPLEIVSKIVQEQIDKTNFIERIARIIIEMINNDLEHVILDILEDLYQMEIFEEMIQLLTILSSASSLNVLKWMKRISDKISNLDQYNRIKMFLRSYLRKNSSDVYESIKTLKQWLPDEKKSNCRKNSERIAFEAIIDSIIGATYEMKDNQFGYWPSNYFFFKSFEPDLTHDFNKLSELFGVIMHPAIEEVFNELLSKRVEKFIVMQWISVPEMNDLNLENMLFVKILVDAGVQFLHANRSSYSSLFLGLVISKWRIILQGNINNEMKDEAKIAYQIIINSFKTINPNKKKQIIHSLIELKNLLKEVNTAINDILLKLGAPLKQKERIRHQIRDRINYLIRIIKDLKTAYSDKPS